MGRLKLPRRLNKMRGQLPDEPRLWASVEVEKRPGDQWQALALAAEKAGEPFGEPDDEDMLVGINVYGHMALPSELLPPARWKKGRALIGTLAEIPLVEFRAAIEADIARQSAPPTDEHKADLAEVGAKALAAARELPVAVPNNSEAEEK